MSAADTLSLSALLSQMLVAFTIEFDNEFEHQIPHRTTNHGSRTHSPEAPWLVSLAMWSNCMRFIGDEGVTARTLESLARTKTNLNGMERWGYVVIAPDPADPRAKPPQSAWLIRATAAGRKAQEVWRPLVGTIERRWEARFGKPEIDRLRTSLAALVDAMHLDLPDCMPILEHGLFSRGPARPRVAANPDSVVPELPLYALLSRVLLAFALEFEHESNFSLAICANVVRVLDEKGMRVRDLPLLSGVSKEAISVAMGILQKHHVAVVEHDADGRTKVARLTTTGRRAQDEYRRLLRNIDESWQIRFGRELVYSVRKSLEQLVGEPAAERSPLLGGLEPYPDGWRASVPRPNTLPYYPMVSHRGGYPDGS